MSLPPSLSCISNGTLNAIQPAEAPTGSSDAVTDAVDPAATVTVRVTVESSPTIATACVPGTTFANTTGVTPRGVPSTVTRAPGGSDTISRRPTAGAVAGAGAISTYCDRTTPA